ncbi:hypothetical protein Dimus_008056 [Dionaea muscipula]
MLLSWSLPLSSAMPPSSCNVNRRNKFTTQSFKSPASIAPGIITYCTSSLRRNPESRAAAAAAAANNDPSSAASSANAEDRDGEEEEGEEFRVLTAIRSKYNSIVILETRESRILLLDDSLNAHSILYKQQKWTNSYWFASYCSRGSYCNLWSSEFLPTGGGTVAHLLLWSWPSLQLDGWELDEILIDKAREYFGLSDLEKYTDAGGRLHIKVGDALSSSTNIPGGYAGIIVDLFSDGKVLPQLEKVKSLSYLNYDIQSFGLLMTPSIYRQCFSIGDIKLTLRHTFFGGKRRLHA